MTDVFEKRDPAFDRITGDNPRLDHLATGFGFTEGPVWRGDHLLFSDIPNSRIVRYELAEEGPHVTTFRYPSGNSNGMTLDRERRLVTCEHTHRRVSRTGNDGRLTVLANRYDGRRFNSPNRRHSEMLNDLQETWCSQSEWDFSDLKALFLNCTLK